MNRVSVLNPSISIINPLIFKGKFNLRALGILIFLIMVSLLVVSVFQLNNYTKEVYLIHSYEEEISQLTQKNKILEVNFSKVNSLKNIDGYLENQIFEKAEQVYYIRILDGTAMAK